VLNGVLMQTTGSEKGRDFMILEGQVALVTGAARGLGRAYALRLARLGADVVIVDRDLNAAAEFGEVLSAPSVVAEIQALGRRSIGVEADLTNRQAAEAAVRQTAKELGRLDILVNNAGGSFTPIERSQPSITPDEDIFAIFEANFYSTIYCCQAAAPIMKNQKSGSIINTSSVSGHLVVPEGRLSLYASAKAAVAQYSRTLAAELGPHGIRVNCIVPGLMLTSRIKAQAAARSMGNAPPVGIPLGRYGEPEDCAKVVEFLASDLSSYVTGQCISVCGGALMTPH
jgi:NAD(P)-dependent dehydrogenase (short-subunit alcohol dehydrogenase family)